MSDEPGAGFGISQPDLLDVTGKLQFAGAESLADAFPAMLLAPTWKALLEWSVIQAPEGVDLARVEVRVVGLKALELRLPVGSGDAELIKVLPVQVDEWIASGDLASQLRQEAERLCEALSEAHSQRPYRHRRGPSQKPHN